MAAAKSPHEPESDSFLTLPASKQSHNTKWRQFGPQDAAFVRSTVIRAEQIRQEVGDSAADAYLQGVADHHDATLRTKAAKQLITNWDTDSSVSQVLQAG